MIVRPDQCMSCPALNITHCQCPLLTVCSDVSAVMGLDDYEQVGKFFQGFLVPQTASLKI